jgi:hypothetical protein
MPRKIEEPERAEPALESKSARIERLLTARDAAKRSSGDGVALSAGIISLVVGR